ncbi:hypothetical protein [Gandjariella thermophila]|nr:hypothetical protein [Gandjariella thermophila]
MISEAEGMEPTGSRPSIDRNRAGVLTDLRLSSRAEGMRAPQLANSIMETYRRAMARGASRTVEIMSPLIGENSASMDFLRSAMPQLDEPGEERRSRPARPGGGDDESPGFRWDR